METKNSQPKRNPPVQKHKYSCGLCPYATSNLHHYKQHLKVHSIEKPFECPECPFRAKWKGSVTTHLKLVHLLTSSESLRPFPCSHSGCNYAAKLKSHLTSHSKSHLYEKTFFCAEPNCNYSANQKYLLVSHTRIHMGEKPFVCQFQSCSFATAHQKALVSHSRTHTKERPYKCPEPNCKYAAAHISHLKSHQLVHEPKEGKERASFSCPICEYSGKSKQNLTQHIKTHTLEKFFKCDEPNCTFEAKTKTEMKSHKVVHSDEQPFACSVEACGFRSKFKSNLLNHLKSHSDERRYKCELCPYRGKIRNAVINHLNNVHSDLRPFKCTEPKCDYAAKTKGNRNQHLLTHKGVKQ